MATKTLTIVRPGRYGTRMLKAGDALEVGARDARLYTKLGWAAEEEDAPPGSAAAPKAPRKRKSRAKKPAA